MPPRKSISSRAEPSSRRGKPRSNDKTELRPAPGGPDAPTDQRAPLRPDDGDSADEGADWEAPPGRMSREQPQYQTGSDYETPDDEEVPESTEFDEAPSDEEGDAPKSGNEFLGDDALPASFSKDRDIYGEDDELPGDEEDFSPVETPGARTQGTQAGRAAPGGRRTGETRVAPLEELEEEDSKNDSPDATRAGPPIKLEITSGPDSGKTKKFNGVRMVIGRTAGCDWKLSDPSASRRHCELVSGDQGVLLRDLGSGNGTKVNGEKVKEKKLEHGDEIAIGKTVIRFIDEVAAFRKAREAAEAKEKEDKGAAEAAAKAEAEPESESESAEEGAEEPKPVDFQKNLPTDAMGVPVKTEQRPALNARRPDAPKTGIFQVWNGLEKKHQLAILGGAGALVLLFALLMVFSSGKPIPPPPDPKIEKAALKMQKAKNLAREGNFEEAAALAAEAEKLVPGTDSDGLAARAAQEAAAQKTLESAKKMMEESRFDDAKVELARASFVTESGNEAKAKLSAELDKQYLAWLQGQTDTALEAKDYDNAKALVGRMPPALQHNYNQKLIDLQQKLAEEEKDQEQQAKKQVKQQKQRAAAQRQAYVEQAFDAVSRKFAAGDYARAALECDRVVDAHRGDSAIKERAAELKRLIPQFGRAYEDGQKKFKAGSLEAAARPLKKARELYTDIGFEGSLGKTLDDELASAALQAAVSSYAREDYPSASVYYRQALKLNPADDRAKDGIAKVNKRAEELYLQAYMIRDREPKEAISKLRVVLQVAEENPTLTKKAKDLLTQME